MVGRIGLVLLIFSAAQLCAQATPDQASGQTSTPQSASGGPAAASPGPDFPLDQFKEFTAIMVGSLMPGDDQEAHIYRSGNLLRMQGTVGLGYFITDLAASETYSLTTLGCLKDNHAYFRAFPFTAAKPGRKFERVPAGNETVDGHACRIEDVTITGGDLVGTMRIRFWEAEDLQGFPIQVQVLNRGGQKMIRYKNVLLGPVDPTLFTFPKHCLAGVLPHLPSKKPAASTNKQKAPAEKSQN